MDEEQRRALDEERIGVLLFRGCDRPLDVRPVPNRELAIGEAGAGRQGGVLRGLLASTSSGEFVGSSR
jgi:hypothetical protein